MKIKLIKFKQLSRKQKTNRIICVTCFIIPYFIGLFAIGFDYSIPGAVSMGKILINTNIDVIIKDQSILIYYFFFVMFGAMSPMIFFIYITLKAFTYIQLIFIKSGFDIGVESIVK